MGVGGLGVVDEPDAVDLTEVGHPVLVGTERPQALAHRDRRHPVGAGQRRGGERVGEQVRRDPPGAVRAEVGEGAQLGRRGLPLLDEGPVGQDVVDDADHRQARHAEGEPDGPAPLDHVGLPDHPLGGGVLHVVDAGHPGALVHAGLGRGIRLEGAVPVHVVRCEVEAARGERGDAVAVVQLEAGQLDGEDVVGLGVHDRLEDRGADVADRRGAQPGRGEDRGQHLHGRGLAVGAGDGEPRRGALAWPQPPGQLDLAPHRDPRRPGRGQHRMVRPPPR